jgi:hypothetical protein
LADKAFQKLFLSSVDDALSSLGESAKQSIYFHLENKFKIQRDEIPSHLDDFESGLERIFGAGTRYLEILIMKKLYENIGSKKRIMKLDEGKDFNFLDYVKAAENAFEKGKKKN